MGPVHLNADGGDDSPGAADAMTEVCARCRHALTQRNADGECMRCLATFAFVMEEALPATSDTTAESAAAMRHYGHFEITAKADGSPLELGHGAMGTTYRAKDTVLHAAVALKIIDRNVAGQPAARARFLREARAAAQLRHPNVASVFHYGEQDGECFYVMELVEGETLEACVRRDGVFPPVVTLEIAEQVARALTAAEARGIVHRDLKPSNLMLTDREGESTTGDAFLVKVIDFGLAKTVSAIQMEATGLPVGGGFVGTPAYASPEQLIGTADAPIDIRSDIYSLGVTLWYLLCGRTPFPGGTPTEVREQQRNWAFPWEQLAAAQVPGALTDLLRSMLALDADHRPRSARTLLEAVRDCRNKLSPDGHEGDHRSPRRATGTRWLLAGVLAAGLVALGWWWHSKPPPPVPGRSLAVLPFENLSRDPAQAFYVTGIQEQITGELARITTLKVIGADSTRVYVPGQRDLAHIGRELSVSHLVEGSVQRDAKELRVTVELVNANGSERPWRREYHRPLAEASTLQNEITRDLARQLLANLTQSEQAAVDEPLTTDPVAYELYLRTDDSSDYNGYADARKHINTKLAWLQEAVTRDPNFVAAYCRIAALHDELWQYRLGGSVDEHAEDQRTLAETALAKARQLRPDDGMVHLAEAVHLHDTLHNNAQALAELALARRTLPNSAELEYLDGMIARSEGRREESVRALEKSASLNPRNTSTLFFLADGYRALRRYDQADGAISRAITLMSPENAVYDQLYRAIGPVEARADLGPLREALAGINSTDEDNVNHRCVARLILALCEHDPDAVSRTLASATRSRFTNNNFKYPKVWFEGLAARMRGDGIGAQAAFASARVEIEQAVVADASDAEMLSLLAVTDAGLGRRDDAVREGLRACELMPATKSQPFAITIACNLAVVYAWTDQPDQAMTLLEKWAGQPGSMNWLYQVSYGDLRLNPVWDPLRKDPRFEQLTRRLAPTK